jgi:hypothetical protein
MSDDFGKPFGVFPTFLGNREKVKLRVGLTHTDGPDSIRTRNLGGGAQLRTRGGFPLVKGAVDEEEKPIRVGEQLHGEIRNKKLHIYDDKLNIPTGLTSPSPWTLDWNLLNPRSSRSQTTNYIANIDLTAAPKPYSNPAQVIFSAPPGESCTFGGAQWLTTAEDGNGIHMGVDYTLNCMQWLYQADNGKKFLLSYYVTKVTPTNASGIFPSGETHDFEFNLFAKEILDANGTLSTNYKALLTGAPFTVTNPAAHKLERNFGYYGVGDYANLEVSHRHASYSPTGNEMLYMVPAYEARTTDTVPWYTGRGKALELKLGEHLIKVMRVQITGNTYATLSASLSTYMNETDCFQFDQVENEFLTEIRDVVVWNWVFDPSGGSPEDRMRAPSVIGTEQYSTSYEKYKYKAYLLVGYAPRKDGAAQIVKIHAYAEEQYGFPGNSDTSSYTETGTMRYVWDAPNSRWAWWSTDTVNTSSSASTQHQDKWRSSVKLYHDNTLVYEYITTSNAYSYVSLSTDERHQQAGEATTSYKHTSSTKTYLEHDGDRLIQHYPEQMTIVAFGWPQGWSSVYEYEEQNGVVLKDGTASGPEPYWIAKRPVRVIPEVVTNNVVGLTPGYWQGTVPLNSGIEPEIHNHVGAYVALGYNGDAPAMKLVPRYSHYYAPGYGGATTLFATPGLVSWNPRRPRLWSVSESPGYFDTYGMTWIGKAIYMRGWV